jgi:uncharacterized membrane protein YtjA (UPF0391 family)
MMSALALSLPLLSQVVFPGGLLTVAIIFFVIAILAYAMGAGGVAGMSAGIGRMLLFVFLALAVLFVIVDLVQR